MKKKNGFTLTELLVVIAMIAVVGTVIIINTIAINNRSKDNEYNRMVENIKNAAKTYVSLYPEAFSDLYSSKAFSYVSLKEIVEAGLIEEEIVNPYTKKNIDLEDKYLGHIKVYVDGDSYEMVYLYPLTDSDYNTQYWLQTTTINVVEDEEAGFTPFWVFKGLGEKLASTDFGFSDENGNFINAAGESRTLLQKYRDLFDIKVEVPATFVRCSTTDTRCTEAEWYNNTPNGGSYLEYYIPTKTGTFEIKFTWSYEQSDGKKISRTDIRTVRVSSATDREKERVSTSAATTSAISTTADADGIIYRLDDNFQFTGDNSFAAIPLFAPNAEGEKQGFTIYIQGVEKQEFREGTNNMIIDHVDSSNYGFRLKTYTKHSNNSFYVETSKPGTTLNGTLSYLLGKRFRLILYYNPNDGSNKLKYKIIKDLDDAPTDITSGEFTLINYSSDKTMYLGGSESNTYQYKGSFEKFIVFNRADKDLINREF